MSDILLISLLLPDIKHTTVRPLISSLYYSSPPIASAPAGSTKIPSSLKILIITVHTWPSGIKLISFKQLLKISKFLWPAFLIAAPSTNVFIVFNS